MAENAYLHTGGVLNRRSGGRHTFKLCTIFSHTLELLLAFPYDWENETILPGDISKDIKHVWLLFCTHYIAWVFSGF